jgi:hypothetical protein
MLGAISLYRENSAIAIYTDDRYTGFLRIKGKLMI